jgi:hypothetical protein
MCSARIVKPEKGKGVRSSWVHQAMKVTIMSGVAMSGELRMKVFE